MRAWLTVALLLAPAACLRTTAYKCTTSDQCGSTGTCESVGYCSFPDPTCGQRFGDSAGDLSNQCVGASPIDAGIHGDVPVMVDAPADASTASCPSQYVEVGGYAGHRYLEIGPLSWDAAKPGCAGPGTFLAIPTEAAALTALDSLVTAGSYWIGVSESGGSFTTVANTPATFLPWAPGQPSTTANSHCAEVSAAGANAGLFDLARCSDAHPAVCECDP